MADLDRLLVARGEGGPYQDPQDLQVRAKTWAKAMELLARAGAFDRGAPDGGRTRPLWDRVGGLALLALSDQLKTAGDESPNWLLVE